MDKDKIKKLANDLEFIIYSYSGSDNEAKKLLESLDNLLKQAKLGHINSPLEHVPGRYWFSEGSLSQYSDLESAYAKFSLAIKMTDKEFVGYEKFKREFLTKKN